MNETSLDQQINELLPEQNDVGNRNFFQRNKKLILIIFIVLLVLYVSVNIYVRATVPTIPTRVSEIHQENTVSPIQPSAEESNKKMEFAVVYNGKEYPNLEVGDYLGELEIVDYSLYPVGMGNVTVEGNIVVEGEYIKYPDNMTGMDSLMNGYICMRNLTDESENNLPKFNFDSRNHIGFCFSNKELAKSLFKDKDESGNVVVTIGKYNYENVGTERVNTAVLKSLIQ